MECRVCVGGYGLRVAACWVGVGRYCDAQGGCGVKGVGRRVFDIVRRTYGIYDL